MKDFSLEEARKLLDYNPSDGFFRWKTVRPGQSPVGTVAGTIDNRGYRMIIVLGQRNSAHRMAWLFFYGEWPSGDIDHINQSKDDNRITNLRIADRTTSCFNRPLFRNSTSGTRGVCWHKASGKWMSQLRKNYRCVHRELHLSKEDAAAAYRRAVREHYTEEATA